MLSKTGLEMCVAAYVLYSFAVKYSGDSSGLAALFESMGFRKDGSEKWK
jgi:hypothetical protein